MYISGLYLLTALFLSFSIVKNKNKTRIALKKSWKALENILPQFLSILLIIGITLAVLSPQTINKFIGSHSGWIGMAVASVIGSVTAEKRQAAPIRCL